MVPMFTNCPNLVNYMVVILIHHMMMCVMGGPSDLKADNLENELVQSVCPLNTLIRGIFCTLYLLGVCTVGLG